MVTNQSAKNYKTFTPQAICNIQYFSLDIFMKTLQKMIVIATIIKQPGTWKNIHINLSKKEK